MQSIVARSLLGALLAVVFSAAATPVAAQPPFMKQLPAASQPVKRARLAAPDSASPQHPMGYWTNRKPGSPVPVTPSAPSATGVGRRLMHLPAVSQAMTPEIAADPLIISPRYSTARFANRATDVVIPAASSAKPSAPRHRALSVGAAAASPVTR